MSIFKDHLIEDLIESVTAVRRFEARERERQGLHPDLRSPDPDKLREQAKGMDRATIKRLTSQNRMWLQAAEKQARYQRLTGELRSVLG